MNEKSVKFVCPHCNGEMEVDMIYFHVRGIFNSPLYKCCQCDFSTNSTFYWDHHKSLTEHQLDDNNNLNPFLEEAINSITRMFMNSVIHRSENLSTVENVTKSKKINEESDGSKQPIGGDGSSINTVSVQRIGDSKKRKKFFLDTINLINNMSPEYEKNSGSCRGKLGTLNTHIFLAVEVIEISTGQKYDVPQPSFGKNKMVLCQKCGEEVHENYLSRRRHVFLKHQDDIKDQLKDFKKLKKTDILFKGFMNIHDCFPEYAVCSDFQCIECGRYYCSVTGVKYHVGASHQSIITINCPFKNCDFKTGGGYHANDHVRAHIKKNVGKKHTTSVNKLKYYVSSHNYDNFNSSCELGSQIVERMLKHYFPISVSHYDNFQDNFKDDLSEFKTNFLEPYVPKVLNTDNQGMDKSEIIGSHSASLLFK
uniref:C2H2-type domain-containing protein n=1 Tax=Strongyloides venezuelensis TaxID=75913 RepID=A0A0K0G3R7_STRVS